MAGEELPRAATVRGARARLGDLSQMKIYELFNSGSLRSFKIGSKRYVSHAAIADFIAQREQADAEERASAARSEFTPAA